MSEILASLIEPFRAAIRWADESWWHMLAFAVIVWVGSFIIFVVFVGIAVGTAAL